MRKNVYTSCANCGILGPAAELTGEALQKARDENWYIGDRPHSKLDYCPDCRTEFQPRFCIISHKGKQSTAIYELAAPEREKIYSCGIHAQQVIRELFASNVTSITITRTTASRRQGKRST